MNNIKSMISHLESLKQLEPGYKIITDKSDFSFRKSKAIGTGISNYHRQK